MQTVNSIMREEFGKRSVSDVVSGERDKIMEVLREKSRCDARKIGVKGMDVRLKRVDYPQEISESVVSPYGCGAQACSQRIARNR